MIFHSLNFKNNYLTESLEEGILIEFDSLSVKEFMIEM